MATNKSKYGKNSNNANAAAKRTVITIRVESVDAERGVCYYKNYHEVGGRTWTFRAMLRVDRETLESLEPGRGYQIVQAVDDYNTTHWTHAMAYSGGQRFTADAIVSAVAKKKAERKVNPNLLDDWCEF